MSTVHSFSHQGFTLAYRVYGQGPRKAIAFHGFGGDGRNFEPIAPALAAKYTTYALDIFFHGESRFPADRNADQPITPEEFAAVIRAFMDAQHIDKAWMLGFSLGGRLAISCIELLPERCAGLWLFAPDGLVRYPWYRAASKWAWGRAIYRAFVQNPRHVHGLFDAAHRFKLISPRRHQFLKVHTEDEPRRKLVYDVWLSLRLLEPDLHRVGANLQKYGLKAQVYLGRHDKVILPGWGKNLQRQAPGNVHLEILNTGHKVVTADLGNRLAELDV